MPIYEYRCTTCTEPFEELVRIGDPVACPGCGSAEVERLLSSFAGVGGAREAGKKKVDRSRLGGHGWGCGGGGCGHAH
jgi:putative FmdB family regulatory protein